MLKLSCVAVCSIGLISFSSHASTVITSENLERLYGSYAAVQALEKQFQDTNQAENTVQLEPHCNWQKHYQSLIKNDNVTPEHVFQYEALIKEYGFSSGGEYLELSMKVMSLSFSAWEAHLKQQNITPDASSAIGKSMLQMQKLNKIVNSCLTDADKVALKRYEGKIAELTLIMAENDDLDDHDDYLHD